MAAKSAIKDVARVVQLPLPESNRLAGLVPKRMPEVNGKELKTTLKNCYEHVDDFKNELQNPNPLVQDTLRYALALEGARLLVRHRRSRCQYQAAICGRG